MTSTNVTQNGGDEAVKDEMVNLTEMFEVAASCLTVSDPMLCNKDTFNLQDSMAALELMDHKMDCCEVAASLVAPFGRKIADENKRVFPRPAPVGLDDIIDPLPWDELTMEDAAYICLESLIRLESLLGGASVVESTFTCLYAHKPVMADMKARLEPSTLTEQMKAIMATEKKGTTAQSVVYASSLMLLELTDVLRSIILNADIYEEEDFTVSTYNIQVFDDRDETSATTSIVGVLDTVAALENQESDTNRIITLILGYELDLLTACTSLAQLAGKDVKKHVERAQHLSKVAVAKLEEILVIAKRMKENESSTTKALIKKTFDSHVNRPLVGNAPVRKIVFREAEESITLLKQCTKELDWGLCNVMLKGNSLGRIRRMLSLVSTSSVNILTRSLVVLNLYFDEKLFGQHNLAGIIAGHMQQLSHIPDKVFANKCSQAFLNRLAKPIYDTLKVLVLNRNRQRAYIEAVMLHDWASLRQEAHIVDVTCRREMQSIQDMSPHFSFYTLCTTIELMDHFVALGIELNLFCSIHELGVAYWYRDFLLSSLFSQLSNMRRSKLLAKQTQSEPPPKPQKGKRKGGKGSHKKNGPSAATQSPPSPHDLEDEFDFMVLNLKRGLCRGNVRFLASLNQAGLVKNTTFEFTTKERIFQKRFEAFASIQQPPPLSYNDYLQGSDFSKVSQNDLLSSTAECFTASRAMVDKLNTQVSSVDKDYLSIPNSELSSLARVCIGNSVYLQKLKQKINQSTGKADGTISIDLDTHHQFCMLKLN